MSHKLNKHHYHDEEEEDNDNEEVNNYDDGYPIDFNEDIDDYDGNDYRDDLNKPQFQIPVLPRPINLASERKHSTIVATTISSCVTTSSHGTISKTEKNVVEITKPISKPILSIEIQKSPDICQIPAITSRDVITPNIEKEIKFVKEVNCQMTISKTNEKEIIDQEHQVHNKVVKTSSISSALTSAPLSDKAEVKEKSSTSKISPWRPKCLLNLKKEPEKLITTTPLSDKIVYDNSIIACAESPKKQEILISNNVAEVKKPLEVPVHPKLDEPPQKNLSETLKSQNKTWEEDKKNTQKLLSTQCETFDRMGLNKELEQNIYCVGFEHPTVDQKTIIPLMLKGTDDFMVQRSSGSGKTGIFGIYMVEYVLRQKKTYGVQGLIMSHTRELASQTYDFLTKLVPTHNVRKLIKMCLCIGKTSVQSNIRDLYNSKTNPYIIVGTPGRLYQLNAEHYLKLDNIYSFVIDEADAMLCKKNTKKGHSNNNNEDNNDTSDIIESFIRQLPKNTQICIFSATFPTEVIELTHKFLRKDKTIKFLLSLELVPLKKIKQFYILVQSEKDKINMIEEIYSNLIISATIIFVNSVGTGNNLFKQLTEKHYSVGLIHSHMADNERITASKEFSSGTFRILISTDLLARGYDLQTVEYVINYDLPYDADTYIHRIGRSGRLERIGTAITFLTPDDQKYFFKMKDKYKMEVKEFHSDAI